MNIQKVENVIPELEAYLAIALLPRNIFQKNNLTIMARFSPILELDEFCFNRNDRLGRGSFGVVYKGIHKFKKFPVAVKEIKKIPNDPDDEFFLMQEAGILRELGQIKHPNLVEFLKSIETPEYLYLVMEFCNAGNLDDFLHERQRLDTATLQHFFKQIAQGLNVMYHVGIIHRDLKPQNIFLCKPAGRTNPNPLELTVKIADFGIARYLNTHELATTLCGSPMYMAPEVVLELPYSIKADLWSVGVMLYECAVGAITFLKPGWSLLKLKRFYTEDGELNLHVPIGTSKRLQELLTTLLKIDQRKRIDFNSFLFHSFFEFDSGTIVVHNLPNNLPPVPKARKIGHNKENQKNLIAPIKEEEEDGQRTMIFSPKKNVDEQIKALPWYYPNVNREDCERILEKQGKVGDYLLRESETKPGVYSLSIKSPNRNIHFTIEKDKLEPGKLVIGDKKFNTIEELKDYYTKFRIYMGKNNNDNLFLGKPINRFLYPQIHKF
uniref:Uncharacterized protein n=1 Tax=Acrobeloides nanus TaxID=290746 RepID=A0A914CIS1_9BILA